MNRAAASSSIEPFPVPGPGNLRRHDAQRPVQGNVDLHVAGGRLQIEAIELLLRSLVAIDVIDTIPAIFRSGKGLHDRRGDLPCIQLGLGMHPRVRRVEKQLAAYGSVEDFNLGHAVLALDIQDPGPG